MFDNGRGTPGGSIPQQNAGMSVDELSEKEIKHVQRSSKSIRVDVDERLPASYDVSTECVVNDGCVNVNVYVFFKHQLLTNMNVQVTGISVDNDPCEEFSDLKRQAAALAVMKVMAISNQNPERVAK